MDFFKSTLDLLKRDDTKLFKNIASPASHKSSPGVNSSNGESNPPSNGNLPLLANNSSTVATPPATNTSNNGNGANGVLKNQPSTTTTTNPMNPMNPTSPITSPNTSEQELWKLLEKQRQRKYFLDQYTNKEKVRKQRKPQPTVPMSNPLNPNLNSQNPQIKPANPSVKRKIGGGGLIQQVNVNNPGPTLKNQQPQKKIKTDIR